MKSSCTVDASVDIVFHPLWRIALTSLINYCPYRLVRSTAFAEERDDIITIINPECPSLCQAGARGRILSTNATHPRQGRFSPSVCRPINPSLGTRCTHDAEYPSGCPTLLPRSRGIAAVSRGTGKGRDNPELEFVHTGLVRQRTRGTIIFGIERKTLPQEKR